MNRSGPLRLAIIGTGSRGMTYGREAVRSGMAVVTAVAEPRQARRQAAAAEFGIADEWSVSDWTELIAAARAGRRCRRGSHPGSPAHRPRVGLYRPWVAVAAGEADGPERGRGSSDRGGGGTRRRAGLRGPRAALLGVHRDDQGGTRRRGDRRRGHRRAPGAGGLVALRALLRPRQLAAGGPVELDADGQVLPRRGLVVLRGGPARGSGVVVRQPDALHRGEQAGRGRIQLPGLRGRAGLPVLGRARSTSSTSTNPLLSGGRWPCSPSR